MRKHYVTAMGWVPYVGMQYACRCGVLLMGTEEWEHHGAMFAEEEER